MTTRSITKKGALQVSHAMDRLASLFEQDHAVMGVSPRIARDFALRLDRMSDVIEKNAGMEREEWPQNPGFNPREVGKQTPGALLYDDDELYVRDNFTQQETSELFRKQFTGQLPYADVLPEQDMMGKLAARDKLAVGGGYFKLQAVMGMAIDKVLYVGRSDYLYVVDILGTMSHDPSYGEKVSFAARVFLDLEDVPPEMASKARVHTFDLKVKPLEYKFLIHNFLVRLENEWSTSLIQHIRRATRRATV